MIGARETRDYARCPASGAEERMSISRHRCLSAWGPSRHAPSFGAPVITRRRRANGHPQFFTGARNVPHHARGRPFPRCRRHRPVVSHDLPRLLGTAPRGVVSPQRYPAGGWSAPSRIPLDLKRKMRSKHSSRVRMPNGSFHVQSDFLVYQRMIRKSDCSLIFISGSQFSLTLIH